MLQPENGRGVDYEANRQDPHNIYCDPVGKEPPSKFIKTGFALNMLRRGFLGRPTHYALWNGRFGTGYTYPFGILETVLTLREAVLQFLGEGDYTKIQPEILKKIEEDPKKYRLGGNKIETTLEETMMNIFETEKYNLLPEETRLKIKHAKVGVVVEFPSVPLTPTGLPRITNVDIHKDNDQKVVNALVNGIKNMTKGQIPQMLLIILPLIAFVGGLLFAYFFHIGGSTATTTVIQYTNSTRPGG